MYYYCGDCMYKRIKDLRIDNEYKQNVIASYLGIDQTTYSRYENGILDIPSKTLKKLAEFYGVTIDYLLEIEIDN